MFQASLRYGIQQASQTQVQPGRLARSVGEQIDLLLDNSADPQVAGQIREALKDPGCVIEVRSGRHVQTATPEMPLRELLPPGGDNVEITVSQPRAGG